MQTDVKRKAAIFTTAQVNSFVNDNTIGSPYWLVRKIVVILAYFGGLRLTETLELQLEMIESQPDGVFVTHQRCKQRSDKRDSRFLVPRAKKEDDVDYAGILDSYLHEIKDRLGVFTGRVLWTGKKTTIKNNPSSPGEDRGVEPTEIFQNLPHNPI